MMLLYVILAILGYLIIGGIIAAILKDDELTGSAVIAWPFMIVLFVGFFVYNMVVKLGQYILESLTRLFSKGEEDNEV